MWFIAIFPVFNELLPYFPFYLSTLTTFTQFHSKDWKIVGTICTFQLTLLCKELSNLERFVPFTRFNENLNRNRHKKTGKRLASSFRTGEHWNFGAKQAIFELHALIGTLAEWYVEAHRIQRFFTLRHLQNCLVPTSHLWQTYDFVNSESFGFIWSVGT